MLTIGGLLSFLIGSNLLIAEGSPDELKIPGAITWTMTACLAGVAIGLGILILRSQRWKRKSGKDELLGRIGVATTPLDPDGMVRVFGEIWQAHSTIGTIDLGANVVIDKIDGLRVLVHPATAPQPDDPGAIGDRRTVIPMR
jgi:membrane-bound serine protease (ClpP class)